ncbi:hypothetical protein [Natronosalvus caseinilyticus]|uniref:hypothetical protein n=1 Tax=Natronosalvus caseinilyticus TaxID=2953747 RepID=UPI0028AE0D8A|nr:hypothetical protein [Natronosalvus caseinilyticus]
MTGDPSFVDRFDDPRITTQFCRRLSGETDVTLLGVVHDHPASIARVETVLEYLEPDTLALELPGTAVPLYRTYARDSEGTPAPEFGGEMAAAIRAAPGADVVGIDAPNWSFLRRLFTRLLADRVPASTARRVLSSLGGATRTALTCRVAATVSNATSVTVACDDPIEYACTADDSPATQAEHERRHVSGVRTLLQLQGDGADATTYRDETRESCMIDHLESLRAEGSVVAVVGVDHLEALETALAGGDGDGDDGSQR